MSVVTWLFLIAILFLLRSPAVFLVVLALILVYTASEMVFRKLFKEPKE